MAIQTIKLQDGTEITIGEWSSWPAFSTYEGSKLAGVDMRLFSYLVGERVPQTTPRPLSTAPHSATPADTNWKARGRVNQDESYVWFSFTYELFALENNEPFDNAPPDLEATSPIFTGTNHRILQRDLLIRLIVGAGIDKPQVEGPLESFGQGLGAPAFGGGDALLINQGAATQLEMNYGTGGMPTPRNQYVWVMPVYVPSDRVVKLNVLTPNGPMEGLDQDYKIRLWVDGIKRRAVA
jgi:hypothetical protein